MAVKTSKRKKRNPIVIILVVVGVLIAGLFIARQAGWIGGEDTVAVNLAKAAKRTIIERVSASGTIQPETEVKISPEVPGEIIALNVKEGDSVEQGSLLIRIRPDNFESAVSRSLAVLNQQKANRAQSEAQAARVQAQLLQLQAAYKRSKDLYDQKVISDADFEVAESNYKVAEQEVRSAKENVQAARYAVQSAQASVREARENLSFTSIYAPVGGTVSKLDVEKGERVVGTSQMAGTEMLRIADLSQMEVRVDVNENDIIRVSIGDTAMIDVDAYSYLDKEFKGVVTAIANTANEKLTSEAVTEFEVRILLLSESYQDLIQTKGRYPFRPGMTASVDIITQRKEDALSVPLASVTTRPDNEEDSTRSAFGKEEKMLEVVFRKSGEAVERVAVTTGISDYENIEILSGLAADDEVVSGPYIAVSKQLKDGSQIAVAKGSKRGGGEVAKE